MNLYPEMNAQIADVLRISGLPEHQYAAELIDSLLVRVGVLESELAQVQAAAVQWVTYTGEPKTLPGIGCTVLFDAGEDGSIVVYYRRSPDNRTWCHFEPGQDDFEVEIGDRWAYLPAPPEASK